MRSRRVSSSSRVFFILFLAILSFGLLLLDFQGNVWVKKAEELRLQCNTMIMHKTSELSNYLAKYLVGSKDFNALETELAETNSRASILSLYMQAIMQENNQLKQLLHYVKPENATTDFQYVATRVKHSIPGLSSSVAYIPIGSDDGVAVGQAIINEKGLVGKILNVVPKGAEVLLINDPRFSMPVVMRDSGEHAMFHGSSWSLIFSHKQPKVFDGEMAMTLGDDKTFPGRIPVGIVKITEGKVAISTRIEPFVDISKLDYVLVITTGVTDKLSK